MVIFKFRKNSATISLKGKFYLCKGNCPGNTNVVLINTGGFKMKKVCILAVVLVLIISVMTGCRFGGNETTTTTATTAAPTTATTPTTSAPTTQPTTQATTQPTTAMTDPTMDTILPGTEDRIDPTNGANNDTSGRSVPKY